MSNMLLLPADANGKPGNFIVDTGAITSVLSLSMANAMGVNEKTPGALVDLGIAGVGGAQGITLMLPQVTLKTVRQSEALSQALAIDLKEVSRMLGTEVSGVAGFDFLSKYKLTHRLLQGGDPPVKVMRLHRPSWPGGAIPLHPISPHLCYDRALGAA